jgi:hypothetical protein
MELRSNRLRCLVESVVDFFRETTIPLWIEATPRVAVMMETEPPPGVGSIEATRSLSCAAVNVQSEVAALLKLILRFYPD